MSSSYNVDDILEEVRRKKAELSPTPVGRPRQTSSGTGRAEKRPRTAENTRSSATGDDEAHTSRSGAAFQLSGMTEELERIAPPVREETVKRSSAEKESARPPQEHPRRAAPRTVRSASAEEEGFTRLDLPIGRGSASEEADGATRVMQAVRSEHDQKLEERRRAKVKEFMKSSFAAVEDEEEESEEDEAVPSLEQFFGGISGLRKRQPAGIFDDEEAPPRGKERLRGLKEKNEASPAQKRREWTPALPEEEDEPDDDNEFKTLRDAPFVEEDIAAVRHGIRIRSAVTGLCLALSLYLALSNLYPLPLFEMIQPEKNMTAYLGANLAVLLVATLASSMVIGSGLISLFQMRADGDTPAALAALASIAQGVALLVVPDSFHQLDAGIYFCVAILALWFNSLGKGMLIRRIERNFAAASADAERTSMFTVSDCRLSDELTEGQDLEDPVVAYSVRCGFPEKFLKLSYAEDGGGGLLRILSPLFLLFAVVLSVVSGVLFHNPLLTNLTVFNAVMCVACPLTATMVQNLPLLRAAKSLSADGTFLSGIDAVEEFDEVNAVVVDAADLYPSVLLHGIKSFAQSRIDETILDAASVMCSVDGLLKDRFLEMIGGKTSILKPVDSITYEDAMGLSAWVDGKRVLIGNRELMQHHGVSVPPKDYEKKFLKEGREILYLANSGEVTALFVLSYQTSEEVAVWLDRLSKRGLSLIVYSTDPNITAGKAAYDYDYPEEYVKVVPARCHKDFRELTAPRERGKAYLHSLGPAPARLRALAAAGSVRQSITTGTVIQTAGLILGYVLIAFLCFTDSLSSLGFPQLLLYQLFWAAAVMLVPNLTKL